MILALSIAGIVFALPPAVMFLANLPLFVLDDDDPTIKHEHEHVPVSVLIPARDEADAIASCIESALASDRVDVEVVVLDDHSTDATATIVQQLAASDPRVRYIPGAELPAGWNGKQHACKQLAEVATHDRLVFLDADVRLRPAALARLIEHQERTGVALLSAFPHQQTGTILEKWIIPMMHFILLGFLPLRRMRASTHPAYAAGCGQLFMTGKREYQQAGTHESIRGSRHDGLKLPRVYRQAGLSTDVVDGTALAECRMYRGARQVIHGVLKNAIEGIAGPRLIVPFSIILLGGSVLPVVTLVLATMGGQLAAVILSIVGVALGHLPRAIAAIRFRQSLAGVICHSPATLCFVGLQWIALFQALLGRQVAWRGRTET